MTTYFGIFVIAMAISGAVAISRLPDQVAMVKAGLISAVEWFGELGRFCGRLARSAWSPPYDFREFLRQCDNIGSRSLPLVALAGAATGVVLSLETRDSLIRFGAKS